VTYPLRGIRVRLAALFAAGFAVLLAVGGVALYWRLAREYRADFDRELQHTALAARSLFEHDRPEFGTASETAAHLLTEMVFADRTIVAVDAANRRFASTLPYTGAPLLDDLDLRVHATSPVTVPLRSGPARVLAVTLPDELRLIIAIPLAPLEARLGRLRLTLALGLPLVLVLGALVGLAASRSALQPVIRLAHGADAIAEAVARGDTDPPPLPPAVVPGDEVGQLRDALQGLVRRASATHRALVEAAERQRAFLADAAHELRTPVAIIRSEAEASLAADASPEAHRAALAAIARESEALGALVGDLLALARARGAEQAEVRERAYLDDVAHEAVARARKLPAAAGREITLGEFGEAPVLANRPLLERAVLALVHNALVHAAPSRIELAAGTDAAGRPPAAWLAVRDWGPGIPAAEVERIFERFSRLDARRPGTGLGLAIARQVAEVHGGTLTHESPADGGARFVLRLPAADGA
jgi:signal transduction histidine kinase